MTEWNIVQVVVVLIGLVSTITVPILKTGQTMTKLSTSMENLAEKLSVFEEKNHQSHTKIWKELDDHDKRIRTNEVEIKSLKNC